MGVNITGVQNMMVEIEQRIGKEIAENRARKGMQEGGKIVYKNMQQSMMSFRDTGATLDEMKISNVETTTGTLKLYIYWKGPKDRFRIIHLNEKGYTRNGKRYTPRGHGAIARALRQSQTAYFRAVEKELSR